MIDHRRKPLSHTFDSFPTKIASLPLIVYFFLTLCPLGQCWIPRGFCSASASITFFVPATSAAVWNALAWCVHVATCLCACMGVRLCWPDRARLFCQNHTSHVALLPCDLYFMEQKKKTQKKKKEREHALVFLERVLPESEREIHQHRWRPPLHESRFSSKEGKVFSPICIFFVFFYLCLFVVLTSIPPAPFSISSMCTEWNDLSATVTFRPGWAHRVKNKMYSHELTPKPVPTGSNHRFITTAERERERETGTGGWSNGGKHYNSKMGHREKSGETLEQEQETMKRWGEKRLGNSDRQMGEKGGDKWKSTVQECNNQEGKQHI